MRTARQGLMRGTEPMLPMAPASVVREIRLVLH
jgi:hypothetical protein